MKVFLVVFLVLFSFDDLLAFSVGQVLEWVVDQAEADRRVARATPDSILPLIKCRGNIITSVENIDFIKLTGDWYEISKTVPWDPMKPKLKSGKWRFIRGIGNPLEFSYTAKIDGDKCLHPIHGTIEAQDDFPGEWDLNYRVWGPIIKEKVKIVYLDSNYRMMILYLCQYINKDDSTCDRSAMTVVLLSSNPYPKSDWTAAANEKMKEMCIDTTSLDIQNNEGGCSFSFEEHNPSQSLPDLCKQIMDKGRCMGSFSRFYFNNTAKQCFPFQYGGCGGNDNNFMTQQDCHMHCIDFAAGGTCKSAAPCGLLCPECCGTMQDGCIQCKCPVISARSSHRHDGSAVMNSAPVSPPYVPKIFAITSVVQCPSKCRVEISIAEEMICNCSNIDVCNLPIQEGECKEQDTPRYAFNSANGICEGFTYSGCGGNRNNFQNLTECSNTCEDVCHQPAIIGPCKANMLRFHFNARTNKCEQFVYGGCQGNENNFENKRACEAKCEDVCLQAADPGKCQNYVNRYHYDDAARKCKEFSYGGCEGNANNFLNIHDCMGRCPEPPRQFRNMSIRTEDTVKCQLAPEEGWCTGERNEQQPRFYYNARVGECVKFFFTGCEGNENNFRTREGCLAICHDVTIDANFDYDDDSNASPGPKISAFISIVISLLFLFIN